MTTAQAFLVVGLSMGFGLLIGAVSGFIVGMLRGVDKERARCIDVVSGRLCDAHYPKREFRARLSDPCDWCDRVAECVDYIHLGLPHRTKATSTIR